VCSCALRARRNLQRCRAASVAEVLNNKLVLKNETDGGIASIKTSEVGLHFEDQNSRRRLPEANGLKLREGSVEPLSPLPLNFANGSQMGNSNVPPRLT